MWKRQTVDDVSTNCVATFKRKRFRHTTHPPPPPTAKHTHPFSPTNQKTSQMIRINAFALLGIRSSGHLQKPINYIPRLDPSQEHAPQGNSTQPAAHMDRQDLWMVGRRQRDDSMSNMRTPMVQRRRILGAYCDTKQQQQRTLINFSEVSEEAPCNGLVADNQHVMLPFQFHDDGFQTGHDVFVGLKHGKNGHLQQITRRAGLSQHSMKWVLFCCGTGPR